MFRTESDSEGRSSGLPYRVSVFPSVPYGSYGKLNKDYAAGITAYDKGHDHILMMTDALADGIVKQFPGKFKK